MERSLDSLAGMAKSAFGAGTSAAMRQATSPKTILEYIINFFTCGGIRRRNETQYQELIETMAETLKSTMPDRGAPLPENIILDDMDGCRVEFNLPGEILVRITKLDKLLYESVKATILRQEKFRLSLLKKYVELYYSDANFLSLRIL